jgi:putative transposase
VVHRALPGKAKTCTVRIQAGKWFACIACDVEQEPLPASDERVGIDVGLNHFEELSVANMSAKPKAKPDALNPGQFLPNGASRKAGLNKSIADAAWSMFRAILTQKAESAGREVIAVNPAYTSQICSECGHRVPKTLSNRVHACPCCGLVVDRDVNAARNILQIAVGQHSVPA